MELPDKEVLLMCYSCGKMNIGRKVKPGDPKEEEIDDLLRKRGV
jgi:hypothetical protein